MLSVQWRMAVFTYGSQWSRMEFQLGGPWYDASQRRPSTAFVQGAVVKTNAHRERERESDDRSPKGWDIPLVVHTLRVQWPKDFGRERKRNIKKERQDNNRTESTHTRARLTCSPVRIQKKKNTCPVFFPPLRLETGLNMLKADLCTNIPGIESLK